MHGKKQNELLHNSSRFLEMELWRLKVHVQEAFCVLSTSVRLMCRLGTGKVSFFSVLIDLSRGVNNFVKEELFLLTIFLHRETLGKSRKPLEPPQYCQYPLALYLNVFYIVAGISTLNLTLV